MSQTVAERKQRQRERQRASGVRTIEISLSAAEAEWLEEMKREQNGPEEGFARRALLLGAVFAVDAGKPPGRKRIAISGVSR